MEINLKPPFSSPGKRLCLNIMRLFIFLFFSTAFCSIPTHVMAQNERVSIKNDTTLSVDAVFDLIKQQTSYRFIYRSDMFSKLPKVHLKKGKIKVSRLLKKSLSTGDISINYNPKTNCLAFIDSPKKVVQQLIISGKVVDKNGVPIPGVTVSVNDGKSAVSTNADGEYTLKAKPGDKLTFSMLGFKTKVYTINKGETTLNVTLNESAVALDQVKVVSTGFQKISRERATGAYDVVKPSQIDKPSSSIAERLVGVLSGVQATMNTDGSYDLQVRGQSSLFADQKPLIVIDGFPSSNGFASINPRDVESITVLKDAAAASIWGAKAGNGVIVITTKSGHKGKTQVSVSSFLRVSPKLDLGYVADRASNAEIIAYEQEGFNTNFWGSLFGPPPGNTINDIGSPYSQVVVAMNEARLGRITNAQRDATLARLQGLNNRGQIKKYLLNTPITQHYNVAISGGNEKMMNRISLQFEDKKTMFKGDDVQDYLLHFKNTTALAKFLDVHLSGMVQYKNQTTNSGGNMLGVIQSLAPWDMLVDKNGNLTDMSYLNYYMPNFNAYVPREKFPYADWSYNPITEINNRDLNSKQFNLRMQAGLTLKIMEGLTLSSKFRYQRFATKTNNYYSDATFTVRQFINETSGPEWHTGGTPTQLVPKGGILQQSKSTLTGYHFRNQLNFSRTFAEDHRVDLVAGTAISNRVVNSTRYPTVFGYDKNTLSSGRLLGDPNTATLWDYLPGAYIRYFYPFNVFPETSFGESTRRFFSLYGNVNYTYKRKYSLTGSYRTDAANIIADNPKYRYDPFWSVGLGWQVGREDFMADIDWLDRLNIRATYGINGNISSSGSFLPLISIGTVPDRITDQIIASIASYGNPTLRWEKTKSLNLGIDFSILHAKLSGSINLYRKKGTDLIVTQSISSVNGTDSQRFNNGSMMNKGIEVSLGTHLPISGNNIVWNGSLNFSYNHNKITKFFKTHYESYDLYDGGTTAYVQGHNAQTLWGYQYGGMMNVGTQANPIMRPSILGENGVQLPLTKFAVGNAVNYMVDQGTTVAPYVLGMRNSFKIYDFNFSFIITAKLGHVFRGQSFNYPTMTGGNTPLNSQYDKVAHSDPNKMIPLPSNPTPRYYFWDRFYPYMAYLTQDASHIRFQEVNLTYNLPSKTATMLGFDSVKFFAQANNLGVIVFNDTGEDPEFPRGTIRPQPAYTLGLQLNL